MTSSSTQVLSIKRKLLAAAVAPGRTAGYGSASAPKRGWVNSRGRHAPEARAPPLSTRATAVSATGPVPRARERLRRGARSVSHLP